MTTRPLIKEVFALPGHQVPFASPDDRLEGLVDEKTAAIFTETITNPLSDVPDLNRLASVARANRVPLVVDSTIATPANCRPLEHGADYVIHSTTKLLNGRNDHGGGAVIVRDPARARMLADSQAVLDDRMSSWKGITALRGRISTRLHRTAAIPSRSGS